MRLIHYTYPLNRRSLAPTLSAPASWSAFENEIDRLFGSLTAGRALTGAFPVDIYEDKENTYVRAELPGVNREAIGVEVVDGQLKIEAKSSDGSNDAAESARYCRTVALSDEIQIEKITARYENGVLTVTLPKQTPAQPKKVNVQVS